MADRVYLDWNASAPLRPEARAAMIAAMDEVGNPSSVHAEGRRAKATVERARAQVAALVGCDTSEVVFTSGATEAIGAVFNQDWDATGCSAFEHDAVAIRSEVYAENSYAGPEMAFADHLGYFRYEHLVSGFGMASKPLKRGDKGYPQKAKGLFALCAASAETGVVQPLSEVLNDFNGELDVSFRFTDATQAVGKVPFNFGSIPAELGACSGHKIGAPTGVGALLVSSKCSLSFSSEGSGQEQGRRAGTENVSGIAGFGAAAEAAQRDLGNGEWDRVKEMRDGMEARIRDAASDLIVFGESAPRLPNTSCFAVPGWRGETQVMQMDLAGFAVSAGSACSSGKVNKASRVLLAMGFDDITASSAIRVSMGPTTKPEEVEAFADAWIQSYRRWKQRAA
ncbi:MAG: cysteine desulfurase family protein [Pikeienuella sp.]